MDTITKIDQRLVELLAQGTEVGGTLYEAAHYLLLAPGKRIRPVLVAQVAEMCQGDLSEAITAGCALEMVHTYSLIHDDLPCMDNDDIRRGKATMHRVYGEATAILVGDFLLTYAFEVLATHLSLPATQKIKLIATLAQAAGGQGMVAGQVLDMSEAPCSQEKLHGLKTAALFEAAFAFGALIANQPESVVKEVGEWGFEYGLLFQLVDDLEDADYIGSASELESKITQKKELLHTKMASSYFNTSFLKGL